MLLLKPLNAQSNKVFIKNEGQWSGEFDYKMQMADGTVFLRSDGMVVNLIDRASLQYWHQILHREEEDESVAQEVDMRGHAFDIKFLNAKKNMPGSPEDFTETIYNYFLGADPAKWRSGVRGAQQVRYEEIYSGIGVRYYFSPGGSLKYDFEIKPNADASQIRLQYSNVDSLALNNGALEIFTSVLKVVEEKPVAYQSTHKDIDTVSCSFSIDGDIVSFNIEAYDKSKTLIIDPELVFSTFIGSSSNNFGFTATYSANGDLYGGGVVFNDGGTYPITLGAFRTGHLGPRVDVAISKFNGSGKHLLYSTFIGGGEDELPYSLIERSDGSLVVYGSTGSANFPTSGNAYDQTFQGGDAPASFLMDEVLFPNGSDIFICVLGPDGGTLPASTYFGGSKNDGFNGINHNYGDNFRGEVIVDSLDNIYIVGNTLSEDLPTSSDALEQIFPGGTNGFAAAFSANLDQLLWSSYIGGSEGDNAISAKLSPTQESMYIAGATSSNDFINYDLAYQKTNAGGVDGYVVQLDSKNGAFISGTYNGSAGRDANFFVDVDHSGDVYLFGQTRGDYPVSSLKDLYIVPSSGQFVHKLSSDLSRTLVSTVFGDGRHNRSNISPTAFMVDECKNVYMSGWGGTVNGAPYGGQGWTRNLPITADAYQSTSQGSDFYFIVLDASWKELRYATYFGDEGLDHVDGGTSRFSPDGTIYQAVCAGCFGNSLWPTTPGAYSNANYTYYGCNMAAVKIKFDLLEVEATASVNIDSGCVPFTSYFFEDAKNQDTLYWIDPQGNSIHPSMLDSVFIENSGVYNFKLVALDTNCGKSDTSEIAIYAYEDDVVSDFVYSFDSCSNILKVDFINLSRNGVFYEWDFGDGRRSNKDNPTHYYVDGGDYDVRLINDNPFCDIADTAHKEISLKKRVSSDQFKVKQDPCDEGSLELEAIGTEFQEYKWELEGLKVLYGKKVYYDVEQSGAYRISLTLSDTICNRFFKADTVINIINAKTYVPDVPNIFTPNGDGVNDNFQLPDVGIGKYWISADIRIFNRWGTLLFKTTDINEAWDGTMDGARMSEGVYYYTISLTNKCGVEKEIKGFLHLMD